jgi:hypothetical protein
VIDQTHIDFFKNQCAERGHEVLAIASGMALVRNDYAEEVIVPIPRNGKFKPHAITNRLSHEHWLEANRHDWKTLKRLALPSSVMSWEEYCPKPASYFAGYEATPMYYERPQR